MKGKLLTLILCLGLVGVAHAEVYLGGVLQSGGVGMPTCTVDDQIPKWDTTDSEWKCVADEEGAGGGGGEALEHH